MHADDDLGAAGLLARYNSVEFDGDQLVAVHLDDGIAVPIRAVCEALGLNLETQSRRVREHEVLAQGVRLVRVPLGGRLRNVVALLHRYIPFWLATVNPRDVGDEVRPKLVRYQIELVDVLAALYGSELPSVRGADTAAADLAERLSAALREVRLAREALLSFQQRADSVLSEHDARIGTVEGLMDDLQEQLLSHTTITAAQQQTIKRALQRLAVRYKQRTGQDVFGREFASFCMALGTPKYSLLPAGKYQAALDWIRKRAAELLPDDPDALLPLQEALL